MNAARDGARNVTVNASPAARAASTMGAAEPGVRHALIREAEPVERDRPSDADAEHEPEQLNQRVRGVGDPGLEVLCRQLPHSDRQRHPREQGDESPERDDVRRRVQAELRRSRRRRSSPLCPRPARRPAPRSRSWRRRCSAPPTASPTMPPGDDLSPAAPEHRRQCSAGKAVGRQPHEPRAREGMSLDLRQLRQGCRGRQLAVHHVLHQAVQLRDQVEIDGRRPHADREAPLRRQRSERELD